MPFNPLKGDLPLTLQGLQDEVNKMFDRVYHSGVTAGPFDGQQWSPSVEVLERADAYALRIEVPGVVADEIDLTYRDGIVFVKGHKPLPAPKDDSERRISSERRYGSFMRQVELPGEVDEDAISAHCAAGVLEITLPKAASCQGRRIEVGGED